NERISYRPLPATAPILRSRQTSFRAKLLTVPWRSRQGRRPGAAEHESEAARAGEFHRCGVYVRAVSLQGLQRDKFWRGKYRHGFLRGAIGRPTLAARVLRAFPSFFTGPCYFWRSPATEEKPSLEADSHGNATDPV